MLAYRTRKNVLGADRLIVVTYNPELFLAQSATILREIRKRVGKFRELQAQLAHPPAKGKRPTLESVQKRADEIRSGRHMKDLLPVTVALQDGRPRLHYRVDQPAWNRLQNTLLGKNILFTDQQSWSDEDIVRAYRGQFHVEDAFKTMKNPHFVSWRPLGHWDRSEDSSARLLLRSGSTAFFTASPDSGTTTNPSEYSENAFRTFPNQGSRSLLPRSPKPHQTGPQLQSNVAIAKASAPGSETTAIPNRRRLGHTSTSPQLSIRQNVPGFFSGNSVNSG